jgi:hypothetical protein
MINGEFYIKRINCGMEFALFLNDGILVKWNVYESEPYQIHFHYIFENTALTDNTLDTRFLKYVLPYDETNDEYLAKTYSEHEIMVSIFDPEINTLRHRVFRERLKGFYTIHEGSHN